MTKKLFIYFFTLRQLFSNKNDENEINMLVICFFSDEV